MHTLNQIVSHTFIVYFAISVDIGIPHHLVGLLRRHLLAAVHHDVAQVLGGDVAQLLLVEHCV